MNLSILSRHLMALCVATTASAAEPSSSVVPPDNSLQFKFLKNITPMAHLGLSGWGPGWRWVGLEAHDKSTGGKLSLTVPFVSDQSKDEVIGIKFEAWKSGPREMKFCYDLSADEDVPVTMVVATLGAEKEFSKGRWQLTHVDGKTDDLPLPVGKTARPETSKAMLQLDTGGELAIAFDPPRAIAFDTVGQKGDVKAFGGTVPHWQDAASD